MAYKKGQYVRSRGGYPARALGYNTLCLRMTQDGKLLLDSIRQNDVTVRPNQVPTMEQVDEFLRTHGDAHTASLSFAEAMIAPSRGIRKA
jgi:hypothetical protein